MRALARSFECYDVHGKDERSVPAGFISRTFQKVISAMRRPQRTALSRPSPLSGAYGRKVLAWLGIIVILGFVRFGLPVDVQKSALRLADRAAAAAGLKLSIIAVTGMDRLDQSQIIDALKIPKNASIFSFDTNIARKRLEGLGWVASAQVMRYLPTGISIEIVERIPFALWQLEGQLYLIDRQGAVIGAMSTMKEDTFGALPLFAGEGAAGRAAEFVNALSGYGELRDQMKAVVRVADRRWDIILQNGSEIRLPDAKVALALAHWRKMNQRFELLGRDLETIDLRLADRLILTPKPGSRLFEDDWNVTGEGRVLAAAAHVDLADGGAQ